MGRPTSCPSSPLRRPISLIDLPIMSVRAGQGRGRLHDGLGGDTTVRYYPAGQENKPIYCLWRVCCVGSTMQGRTEGGELGQRWQKTSAN